MRRARESVGVMSPASSRSNEQRRSSWHADLGLDIHPALAEAVVWDEGALRRLGRVDMRRHLLEAFAKRLSKEDIVVVEATGNASSVAGDRATCQESRDSKPQARANHRSREDQNRYDRRVLVQFYAIGFLPEVGILDEPTQALRRRAVRQRSR
jgi:transposase